MFILELIFGLYLLIGSIFATYKVLTVKGALGISHEPFHRKISTWICLMILWPFLLKMF